MTVLFIIKFGSGRIKTVGTVAFGNLLVPTSPKFQSILLYDGRFLFTANFETSATMTPKWTQWTLEVKVPHVYTTSTPKSKIQFYPAITNFQHTYFFFNVVWNLKFQNSKK